MMSEKRGNIEAKGKEVFVGVIFLLVLVAIFFGSAQSFFPDWSDSGCTINGSTGECIEGTGTLPNVMVLVIPLFIVLIVVLWFLSLIKTKRGK